MTQFLDLDALAKDEEYSVKLKGETHILKMATVETFIENTKSLEKLAAAATQEEEIEVILDMLLRAFPTMKREAINSLTLPQLVALKDFAMTAGGEKVAKTEDNAEGAGDPPSAS